MGCASSSLCWSANVDVPGLAAGYTGGFTRIASSTRRHGENTAFSTPGQEDAIAIVGIGCRTPGADNIRDYWRPLQNGENHVTDVPGDRWNASAFLNPDPMAPGKAYVQKGGFMKDVESFDNNLYGINDFEASQMDPQQCLLLECTHMAQEDAGFTRKQISGSTTGVFIGDCEQAICGGVNCMLTPDMFVLLSKARLISPTGQCHTFSDKADGYTRGEGCGVVS